MSAVTCPSCEKPLPASVLSGPSQAVLRCDGCAALLLWSNGRVVRTAKSSAKPTAAPRPTTRPPQAPRKGEPPLPELKPQRPEPLRSVKLPPPPAAEVL